MIEDQAMGREELVKTIKNYKGRVIDTAFYANSDSYRYPRLPEKEAAEQQQLDKILATDAALREELEKVKAERDEARIFGALSAMQVEEFSRNERRAIDRVRTVERQLSEAEREIAELGRRP